MFGRYPWHNGNMATQIHNPAEQTTIVVIGGGPGGYEAALVAQNSGAHVILIEDQGAGGSAVITDVVPSKTLIASAEWMKTAERASQLRIGSRFAEQQPDLLGINARVRELAQGQSADVLSSLRAAGVEMVDGRGYLESEVADNGRRIVSVGNRRITADFVLIATGAHPRELESAKPDGKRILTWKQLYHIEEVPGHLIVVGSGVTGAEFAAAYQMLGVNVTLVSSRDRVLPNQDPDAAAVIERVFEERGMRIMAKSRATAARVEGDRVIVTLADGREIIGSHVLMAVGAIPNTAGIGLEEAGVVLDERGYIVADRVSRTKAHRVYAAGDCTGLNPLASVAGAQGRIAIAHALGDSVEPIRLDQVSANIFTNPEIATVGVTQAQVDSGEVDCVQILLPLAGNARSKMRGESDGFVKLFARTSTRVIAGGVVVSPHASEDIFPITMAVTNRLTVDEVAKTFTVYPSISGSITEAARRLHVAVDD